MAANTVFVGGVPPMCASSLELARRIVQAIRTTTGLKPTECAAPEPRFPGRARFAFVTFRCEDEARECIRYDQHIFLDGVPLTVRIRRNGTKRTETEDDKVRLDRGVRLEMGHLTGQREVCVTWRANGSDGTNGLEGAPKEVVLEADFSARRLTFTVRCADHDRGSSTGDEAKGLLKTLLGLNFRPGKRRRSEYKMEFLLRDVSDISEILGRRLGQGERAVRGLIIEIRSPPRCFVKSEEKLDPLEGYVCSGLGSSSQVSTWREEDEWSRTVDFTGNDSIGRSFCYVVFFPNDETNRKTAREMCRGFSRFHLLRPAVSLDALIVREWEHCRRGAVHTPEVSSFPAVHGIRGVPFHLMFQVQQLVQHGVVAESALARDARFYAQLLPASRFEEQIAKRALKEMVGSSAYIFRPAERLSEIRRKLRKRFQGVRNDRSLCSTNLPPSLVSVRRLEVTPTKVYCLGPETGLANRVIRKLRGADRLMRVTFRDEGGGQLSSRALQSEESEDKRSDLYHRIEAFLRDGFAVGSRRYVFLAFSTSQVREQAVWFYAPEGEESADRVRAKLGDFAGINNVAKCAARMGQCFSDTRATVDFHQEERIQDIERNGYCFSDGIGLVSPDLADDVARALGLPTPSAFQIRYGGYKGVLAVYPPWAGHKRLGLRKSMEKFKSADKNLEVISWSRFLPAFLNRQIITLLSTLGVPTSLFQQLQEDMVSKLGAMMESRAAALQLLCATCPGDGQWTAKMMLEAGFDPRGEPHLCAMLRAFQAEQLRELRTRARIFVPRGACLLGCLDEDCVLEEDEVFVQLKWPEQGDGLAGHVPTWVKTSKGSVAPRVLTGEVIVVKNPCLWPGDVRKMTAVDRPQLRHHMNTVVFSEKGARPTPSLLSDGDLDGDKFFVFWEPALVFPGDNWEALDYRPQPPTVKDKVSDKDIQHFFLEYLVNDSLGPICNAHVVIADRDPRGAASDQCRQLAALACTAVDYPKTGHPAVLPRELRPVEYPDFMEKEDKPVYQSQSVLGQLYRAVKERATGGGLEVPGARVEALVLDGDLEVPGFKEHLDEAWIAKGFYDQEVTEIMHKYRIESEAQVVTGCIGSMSALHRVKPVKIKERIREAFGGVTKKAREIFEYGLGVVDREEPRPEERISDAERAAKAYAYYYVTYSSEWRERKIAEGEVEESDEVLLSFPWVAADVLGSLKARKGPR